MSNFLVDHPSWDCSNPNSLNFGVPVESETNEVSKGLVLDGGGHVHIRHITPYLLIDVGCCNPPTLRARRPRKHTCTTRQSGSDTILSHLGSALP
ncbi:unnamed protein product [Prunus armeniaca]